MFGIGAGTVLRGHSYGAIFFDLIPNRGLRAWHEGDNTPKIVVEWMLADTYNKPSHLLYD